MRRFTDHVRAVYAAFEVPRRMWWERIPYGLGWWWRVPYGWWFKLTRRNDDVR